MNCDYDMGGRWGVDASLLLWEGISEALFVFQGTSMELSLSNQPQKGFQEKECPIQGLDLLRANSLIGVCLI